VPDFRKASLFKDSGATRVREPYDYDIGRRTGDKYAEELKQKQTRKIAMIGARINARAGRSTKEWEWNESGLEVKSAMLGLKPCHALPCSYPGLTDCQMR
jgi:hypothetical protein